MSSKKSDKKSLARRTLEACRNQLFFENRFLEQALFRLQWEDDGAVSFGSEGIHLYYSADYVLERYMQAPQQLMLDYLHTVIHCLYQHPFFVPQEQGTYWDLASDIAAECILEEVLTGKDSFLGETAEGKLRHSLSERIRAKVGVMSAQKIFVFLRRNMLSDREFHEFFGMGFAELYALFRRDEHQLWYARNDESDRGQENSGRAENEEGKSGSCQSENDESGGETDSDQSEKEGDGETDNSQPENDGSDGESDNSQPESDERNREAGGHQPDSDEKTDENGKRAGSSTKRDRKELQRQQAQLQQMWRNVAEQVLLEAQSAARHSMGNLSGNMVTTLRKLTREAYDYATFLSKFASRLEERVQTDLDAFDYIFYTYGLRIDRRMPLIEPLEYKEKYLLREFVIAIDTSGSCEGELVERFLTKTYNILRQAENFTSRVNIHIIQCDAAVQEDVTIRSQEDLEQYISHLTLKGFGGTDFRPVFEHVERLLETGALQRIEGLLYFTDGYGVFPAKPTKYKTAFVFLGREEDVKVPAWAMKVYIDEEELS